ncbi:hypothetical protein ACJMK2_043132, partial [Sinanodonta woodiana]
EIALLVDLEPMFQWIRDYPPKSTTAECSCRSRLLSRPRHNVPVDTRWPAYLTSAKCFSRHEIARLVDL